MSFNALFQVVMHFAVPLLASSILIVPPSLHAHTTAQFICRGDGSPLSWRDPSGRDVANSARTKITNSGNVSVLSITALRANDSGEYTCTDSSSLATTYLYVIVYPTITTPVIQIFTEGQQGCIACTVDFVNTQGRSRLWWVGPSDNGSVLRPVINTSTCVCIEHITPRDAGTYQFIVDFDGVGNINQSIQVLVLSPYTATPTETPSIQGQASTSGVMTTAVHVPTPSQTVSLAENRQNIHVLFVNNYKCDPTMVGILSTLCGVLGCLACGGTIILVLRKGRKKASGIRPDAMNVPVSCCVMCNMGGGVAPTITLSEAHLHNLPTSLS